MEKYFLITIDTEGDNLWAKSQDISTNNAKYLDRFQRLCDKFGFKPTYLTNYEMAESKTFQKFARKNIKHNKAEIGMHLHAWNSPPYFELTDDDYKYHPFLIEYPKDIIIEKINHMTQLLEQNFESEILSHRAGRWSFDETYAKSLIDSGYKVDCSVMPHVSLKYTMGDPNQSGGTDYTYFPDYPYFINENNISETGNSTLLEVPMTVIKKDQYILDRFRESRLLNKITRLLFNKDINRAVDKYKPNIIKFRPNGQNLDELKEIIYLNKISDKNYLEFMLHSSELMPGGSPTFKTSEHVENLYHHLELIFSEISKDYVGKTLTEYHYDFVNNHSK
jgi:hypothetical protein